MFRFNRIYPSQLGHIRVLRVSDRPDRSMEVQHISKNGHVLASLRAYKTHSVVCEMLILGRSRAEVTITLERLRRWLLDSGTAELEMENGRTCLAECTRITAPEYRGISAGISVTFTCRNADETNPETDAFTFAGRHVARDMGCIFLLDRANPVPTVTPYKLSIPGLPGTIRYEEVPEPEEKTFSGTLYLMRRATEPDGPIQQAEIIRRLRKLSTWLLMNGRAPLIWDAEPDISWQAEFVSAEFDRQEWHNGRLRVQFVLQPVGIGQEVSRTVQVSMKANVPCTLDLTDLFPDGTGYTVPVDLVIRNKKGSVGRVSVNCTGMAEPFVMGDRNFQMNTGDILRIMGTERIVFLNGKPAGIYVLSGDYPVMPTEDLCVTLLMNTDADLEITARCCPRWI